MLGFALIGSGTQTVAQGTPSAHAECLPRVNYRQDNKPDETKPEGKDNPFSAEEQKQAGRPWGIVVAKQHGVMAIPVPAGGLTPLQRAQTVAERMGKLYQAGVRFRDPKNYVVGELNGQIVLALRAAASPNSPSPQAKGEETKVDLLFTVDTNLAQVFTQNKGQKRISRVDIAFYWRDLLIKALTEQTDIALPADRPKDEWAAVPAGYAHGHTVASLRASQIRRSEP